MSLSRNRTGAATAALALLVAGAAAYAGGPRAAALPADLETLRGDYALGERGVVYVGGWSRPDDPYLYRQRGDERQRLLPQEDGSFRTRAGERLDFKRGDQRRGEGVTFTSPDGERRWAPRVDPYEVRDARVIAGAVTLEGTLLVPRTEGPHAAVVFVHGSGPDFREGYLDLADHFARHGVAAFVYDKRGTGGSTGDRATVTFDQLADDAVAAVRWVRTQPGIAPDKVGLWGISQGGWVVPTAAARSSDVGFIITISASGVSPGEQERWRIGNNLFYAGLGPAALDVGGKAWDVLFSTRELRPLRDAAPGLWWHGLDPALEPRAIWERVQQPVLAIWGEVDGIVPGRESLEIVRTALERAGNPRYRLRVFPRAEHNLLLADEGFEKEPYGVWRRAPGYLDELTTWVRALPGGSRPEVVVPEQVTPTRLGWHLPRAEHSVLGTAAVQLPLWSVLALAFAVVLARGLLRVRRRRAGGALRSVTGAVGIIGVAAFLISWQGLAMETSVPAVLGLPWAMLVARACAVVALLGTTALLLAQVRARTLLRAATFAALLGAFVVWAAYWRLLPFA